MSVTRDSYSDTKGYVETKFQRGKDVLDSELNEAQKIARAREAKALTTLLGDAGAADANGGRVTSDGATANQLIVKAGKLVVHGTLVHIPVDVNVTGLTTPGGNRVDDVYIKIREIEVNAAQDPDIADSRLGETTRRTKLEVTFVVDEGQAAPPTSDANHVYLGGTRYLLIARVFRAAAAIIATDRIVDLRPVPVNVRAAQDRNMGVLARGLAWDGAVLTIASLTMYVPGQAGVYSMASVSITTSADKHAVGWLATANGNHLRRYLTHTVDFNATEDHNSDDIGAVQAIDALTAISTTPDRVFLLGVRIGTLMVLRDGTVMNVGDTMHTWGSAASWRSYSESVYTPLVAYRDPSTGAPRAVIDHNGFPLGQYTLWVEDWRNSVLPNSWALTTQTGGANAVIARPDSATSIPWRHADLSTIAGGGSAIHLASQYITYFNDDRIIVMEWEARTGTAIDHGFSMDFRTGLVWRVGGADTSYIGFRLHPDTNANILATHNFGGVSETSSGVAGAVSTLYRLKLEVVGNNNHAGADALIRWFINGALVHSATAVVTTDEVRVRHSLDDEGLDPGAGYNVYVGPNKVAWNHRLTPDYL